MYDAVVTCIPEDTPRGGIEDFWNAMRKQMQPGAFAFIVMPNTNQLDLAYLTVGLAEAGWETGFTTTLHADVDSERYIVAAMVPLSEKTYVDQAIANGKGITWLDDCGVPTAEDVSNHSRSAEASISKGKFGDSAAQETHKTTRQEKGCRFPANLLIQDDRLNDGTVSKSTGGKGEKSGNPAQSVYGEYGHYIGGNAGGLGDSGSPSRYFDLDAVAQKYGWVREEALPLYLITLSTRPGDTVFDPFDSIVGLPEKIDRKRAGL